MAATNTKKLTSFAAGTVFRRCMLYGGVLAAILQLVAITADSMETASTVIGGGVLLLAAALIWGLIAGARSSGAVKKLLRTQEAGAAIPLDSDVLEPLTEEKNILLGREWLVLSEGDRVTPLSRSHIRSVDSVNARREGMQRFWLQVHDDTGKSYPVYYRAVADDPLSIVSGWLGQRQTQSAAAPGFQPAAQPYNPGVQQVSPSLASPLTQGQNNVPPVSRPAYERKPQPAASGLTAPAVQTKPQTDIPHEPVMQSAPSAAKPAAAGECPHCLGPNPVGAKFCQWCGKPLS